MAFYFTFFSKQETFKLSMTIWKKLILDNFFFTISCIFCALLYYILGSLFIKSSCKITSEAGLIYQSKAKRGHSISTYALNWLKSDPPSPLVRTRTLDTHPPFAYILLVVDPPPPSLKKVSRHLKPRRKTFQAFTRH